VPGIPFNHPSRPTGTSSIAHWHYAHRGRCSAADMVDSCRGRSHRRWPLPVAHDEEREEPHPRAGLAHGYGDRRDIESGERSGREDEPVEASFCSSAWCPGEDNFEPRSRRTQTADLEAAHDEPTSRRGGVLRI
jgi:hypothetical protein